MSDPNASSQSQRGDTLVIIPALNEEKSLPAVITSLRGLDPKLAVLVIDDGSTDATRDVARAAGALVVSHPFNLGYGAALQTG